MTRFAAVVPVIDERDAIGDVVRGLHEIGACCVLVVDGGSTDGTPTIATGAGAIVLNEPRRGYGRACLTGAAAAIGPGPHQHDLVAFLDGDGSCDPSSVRSLVAVAGDADVVLGHRPGRGIEPGAMPWHARLGNRLVASIVSIRSGRRVRDLPPVKLVRADVLGRLRLDEAGYGWTVQLVGRALVDPAVRVREIPVPFRRRRGGVSKVSGDPRASIRAAFAMIRAAIEATRSRPVLAMMAKAARVGHAKTRLAADLGDDLTAGLWSACLSDTAANLLGAARTSGSQPMVMVADPSDVGPVVGIIGPAWLPVVQEGTGLSGALIDVFLAAFERGTDRAMAVAGDVPTLPPTYAIDALERLGDRADRAVLGPSADGGYHLVGLRWRGAPRWWPRAIRRGRRRQLARRLRTAFDVPMGGATALEATKRGLGQAGWTTEDLEPWRDLDTIADLDSLSGALASDGRFAPRTAAWVANHDRAESLTARVPRG